MGWVLSGRVHHDFLGGAKGVVGPFKLGFFKLPIFEGPFFQVTLIFPARRDWDFYLRKKG